MTKIHSSLLTGVRVHPPRVVIDEKLDLVCELLDELRMESQTRSLLLGRAFALFHKVRLHAHCLVNMCLWLHSWELQRFFARLAALDSLWQEQGQGFAGFLVRHADGGLVLGPRQSETSPQYCLVFVCFSVLYHKSWRMSGKVWVYR